MTFSIPIQVESKLTDSNNHVSVFEKKANKNSLGFEKLNLNLNLLIVDVSLFFYF